MAFIKPAPGRLLLQPIDDDKSVVIVNQDKDMKPRKGKVIAVGSDFTTQFGAFVKAPCKVGDIVSHETIGFEEVEHNHKIYRIVPFINIIGIWQKLN